MNVSLHAEGSSAATHQKNPEDPQDLQPHASQGLVPGAAVGALTGALLAAFAAMPLASDGMDVTEPLVLGAIAGLALGGVFGLMVEWRVSRTAAAHARKAQANLAGRSP